MKTKSNSIVLNNQEGTGGGTGSGGSGTAAPSQGLPDWIQILLGWFGF